MNKYKINWDDKDTKEAIINSTVNRIILKVIREKYPKVVKKIEKMVKDKDENT